MPGTVVGVASERDVLVLEADANPAELLTALDEHHVAGKQLHVSTGPSHTTLVISRENLHDQPHVQQALTARFGRGIQLVDDLGAVSAIGAGINATYANVRTGILALGDAGVSPHGMSTLVPHHVDGAERSRCRSRASPARLLHRSRRAVGALGRGNWRSKTRFRVPVQVPGSGSCPWF
jgi:aspartate kinase